MSRRSSSLSIASALATLVAAGAAHAQTEPAAPGDPTAAPGSTVEPSAAAMAGAPELLPIQPAMGRIEIRVPLVINLSEDSAGDPTNLPLDIYYGVSDELTLGITHSNGVVQAASPYPPFRGICFTDACNNAYDNIGLDALYRILGGTLQLAGHGGVDFNSFDPLLVGLRLGVLFQAPLASRVALVFDPRVSIALTKRDEGNDDFLSLPLGVQFWALDQLRLAARTVVGGPFDNFDKAWTGSLGIFAGYAVNETVEAFASFDFFNLYGENGGSESRLLVLGANVRL